MLSLFYSSFSFSCFAYFIYLLLFLKFFIKLNSFFLFTFLFPNPLRQIMDFFLFLLSLNCPLNILSLYISPSLLLLFHTAIRLLFLSSLLWIYYFFLDILLSLQFCIIKKINIFYHSLAFYIIFVMYRKCYFLFKYLIIKAYIYFFCIINKFKSNLPFS